MNFKPLIIILSIIALQSCTSALSVSGNSEPLINTDGVYIAINNYSNTFTKTNDTVVPVKSIKILRFLSQTQAIIVPDNISDNEVFNDSKISKLYDWCLDFEKKNPSDKSFIYVKPKFINDSLFFEQQSPEANIIYSGVNYKDSISISYSIVNKYNLNAPKMNPKFLNFKFYKLNK